MHISDDLYGIYSAQTSKARHLTSRIIFHVSQATLARLDRTKSDKKITCTFSLITDSHSRNPDAARQGNLRIGKGRHRDLCG
jgi:hypothetical protein